MERRIGVSCVALALATACSSGGSAGGGPGAPAVTVQPAYAAVLVNGSAAFAARIAGVATAAVTWSVEPAGCGTVTAGGAFTAPAAPGTCVVRATSTAAPIRSGTSAVTIVPGGGTGLCGAAAGQLFPPGAPWNVPVDAAPLDAESDAIVAWLAANHTSSSRFQITFDFNLLYSDPSTVRRSFTRTTDFYSPDCDPAPVPVPAGGRLESETSYACTTGGDCHLTVIAASECRLYEMWRANIADGTATGPFSGGCLAIWDLSAAPPATGRGDFCTSADAAGLPILPLVFTADEVASGTVAHALRFVLPNTDIRRSVYVRPATHSTGATGGGASTPPYGARLRLKATTDVSGLSAGAQVLARALKKYGMILADGGNVTFTAATDDLTVHGWAEVGVSSGSLKGLSWADFEVVELGSRIDWTSGDCTRTPITN